MPAEIEIVENGQNGQPEVKDDEVQAENGQNGQTEQNAQTPAAENNQNNQHSDVIIIEPVAEPEEPPYEEPPYEEPAYEEPESEPKRIIETEKVPEIIQPPPLATQNGSNGPKKVSMTTSLDTDAVKAAYEDVRSDSSKTQWAVFKFEGSRIVCSAKGADFDKFREQFTDNDRGFGYIRIQTGDEMSKRQKFLFVTWVGPSVSVIQRAKMSTDKSVMKNIISNFAVELQLENDSEFDLKHFIQELNKAGGANYGTGIRDN